MGMGARTTLLHVGSVSSRRELDFYGMEGIVELMGGIPENSGALMTWRKCPK